MQKAAQTPPDLLHCVAGVKWLGSDNPMVTIEMEVIASLPPYYKISETLWGKDSDVDSDGNSMFPESEDWTELTLILRSDKVQRIDIDPVDGSTNHILTSEDEELARMTLSFLKNYGAVK